MQWTTLQTVKIDKENYLFLTEGVHRHKVKKQATER